MAGKSDPETNVALLLKHLKAESLAESLVRAHGAKNLEGKTVSMKVVLTKRIDQAKAKLDGAAD